MIKIACQIDFACTNLFLNGYPPIYLEWKSNTGCRNHLRAKKSPYGICFDYFAKMYTKQEASQLRKNFWTSFGQYMRPIAGAEGETVNWLNYKTGVRHLYFRMDVDNKKASIAIEMRHPDILSQQACFEKFLTLKNIFHDTVAEDWKWQLQVPDEDGKPVSRIITIMPGINIFNNIDWPAVISFLKPRILALDNFWILVKEQFF